LISEFKSEFKLYNYVNYSSVNTDIMSHCSEYRSYVSFELSPQNEHLMIKSLLLAGLSARIVNYILAYRPVAKR
jgi:hypothetical protein